MKNRFDKLIYLLMAIREYAKFIHYTASGSNFYAVHKFMDDISQNLNDYIDTIKEVCLMGNKIIPSGNYLTGASALMPAKPETDKDKLKMLSILINNTLSHIDSFEDISRADEDILGEIARDLKKNYGLLLRQVK